MGAKTEMLSGADLLSEKAIREIEEEVRRNVESGAVPLGGIDSEFLCENREMILAALQTAVAAAPGWGKLAAQIAYVAARAWFDSNCSKK